MSIHGVIRPHLGRKCIFRFYCRAIEALCFACSTSFSAAAMLEG